MRRARAGQLTKAARPAAAGALAVALLGACAGDGTERNLAPFWSEHAIAGGGIETEAFGGALRLRATRRGADFRQVAVRPLWIRDRAADDSLVDRFLTPFGYASEQGDEYVWQLLPIARYDERVTAAGEEEWTFFALPGIYWSKRADGRTLRGWFPFAGVMETFLSYDRIEWVLFPIWMRTERAGRVTQHFLWPIFAYTDGAGGPSWRVWPLVGNSVYRGRYERWFVLWPFFSWQRNNLALPPEAHETKWMVFPLFGHASAGDYRSTTLLWPFFGWSSNPSNGYYAVDAPWPLVRVMRDPGRDQARTRAWPLWSEYRGDGLESTWWGWPFLNRRREVYDEADRTSWNLVPFVQTSTRKDEVAGESSYEKIWPLWRIERREPNQEALAFPALNPLWRTPEIDEMYAWIWELYAKEKSADVVRERAWLGLWRREKDRAEERQAFSGLWASRRYASEGGRVRETSLLFGLLRWRTGPEAPFELLAPALPGPGWPLERARAPATVAPDAP